MIYRDTQVETTHPSKDLFIIEPNIGYMVTKPVTFLRCYSKNSVLPKSLSQH